MSEEKILYKYSKITPYSLSSLGEHYLYFSTPKQLNDPEDSITPIKYIPDNDSQILEWIKHFLKLQNGKKHINKFPYDTVDSIKRSIINNGYFKALIDNSFDVVANSYHVFCLTESDISEYMWTHKDYGNNYNGFCIGYKTYKLQADFEHYFIPVLLDTSKRNEFFFPYNNEIYACTTKMKYNNDRKHFYNFFEQNYSKDYSIQEHKSDTKNAENIIYNLFNKTDKWKEEQEWRAIYYDNEKNDSRVYYDSKIIDSITFGHNTTNEDCMAVINNIDNRNVKIYKTQINNGTLIRIPFTYKN